VYKAREHHGESEMVGAGEGMKSGCKPMTMILPAVAAVSCRITLFSLYSQ
jgi:hypothetical protein